MRHMHVLMKNCLLQKGEILQDIQLAVQLRNISIQSSRLCAPKIAELKFPDPVAKPEECTIGTVIKSFFELTLDESTKAIYKLGNLSPPSWRAAANRKELSLTELSWDDTHVPYPILMSFCMSMFNVNINMHAIAHVGTYNCVQTEPVYYGDAVRGEATMIGMERKKNFDLATFHHKLIRASDNKTVLNLTKGNLFPVGTFLNFPKGEHVHNMELEEDTPLTNNNWWQKVQSMKCFSKSSMQLQKFQPNQIYLHKNIKTYSDFDWSAVFRFLLPVNDHTYNTQRLNPEDILAVGTTVLCSTMSNAYWDLGRCLYTEVETAYIMNKVHQGDVISSVSYVLSVQAVDANETLEKVELLTFGIKNKSHAELEDMQFPAEMFNPNLPKPGKYELMFEQSCPMLFRNVACAIKWTVTRQKQPA